MAVEKEHMTAKLTILLETEEVKNGKHVMKTCTLGNIKEEADAQVLYDAALALSGLQKHALSAVKRVETAELVAGE